MKMGKVALGAAIIAVSVVTGGCSHKGISVDPGVVACCSQQATYTTYGLTLEDTPEFLKTVMEEEFSVAFAKKGMVRDEANRDLVVELKLLRVNLTVPFSKDQFSEHLAPGDSTRFQADMLIEVYEATTNELIWSGSIGRIHNVVPGESMPLGEAKIAIAAAFDEVLKGYPTRRR
jgi:hypothetical protein|tara:strand:- start:2953 stop:3477 length:525 start_codon:yes stop_codon:yes gene_type:complete